MRVYKEYPVFRTRRTRTGRWPEKSVKFVLRLLKNAESNADAKNIDVEDLYIKNIVVEQAPVRAHIRTTTFPYD